MQRLNKETLLRDLFPITRALLSTDQREVQIPAGTFRMDFLEDGMDSTWRCSFEDENGRQMTWDAYPLQVAIRSLEQFYLDLAKADFDMSETLVDVLDRDSEEITILRHEAERILDLYEITEAVRSASSNDPGDIGKAATANATEFSAMSAADTEAYWRVRNDAVWSAFDRGPFCDKFSEPCRIATAEAPTHCP